jgi:integrase/recombinase XerD
MATQSVTRVTLKPAPTVTLWLRDGNRYLKPVEKANHKLQPLVALDGGVPKKFDKGVYCLRYRVDGTGRRTWEPVGNDPQQAQFARGQKELALHAVVNRIIGNDQPVAITLLTAAGKDYLDETLTKVEAGQLARSTFTAYRRVVNTFLPFVAKARTFEQVNRVMILCWIAWLQDRGLADYTVEKRVDMLRIFFNHFGAKWPLKEKDKPSHTPSPAKPYLDDELNLLLQHGTVDEIDVVMFLYGSGGRKGEVQHAHWTDINWERGIFIVTEKRAKKRNKKKRETWKTKDGQEGEVPIDPVLMERLRKRRERYPDAKLIFPGKRGKPNCNLLDIVKNLALKAGVNCAECLNKHGLSCKDHPVCDRVICHRFRKNFASMQHHAGTDSRTIQKWLRHSDLETTEGYLAASANDLPEVRERVNRAYSHLAVPNA